jgi:hypothetical protein
MKNKLAKQAYFIKRMRDSGYAVGKVFEAFSETDPRSWTIMINPSVASVFCTCYANHGEARGIDLDSTCYFELFDGGQFIPSRIKIDTSSFEIIIEHLLKFGIEPITKK